MGTILKFQADADTKHGFRRARKQKLDSEKRGQLNLFTAGRGRVLQLPLHLSPFEKALLLDERGSDEATKAYRRAIELGDNPADAFCNLGILESRHGYKMSAFDCLTSALGLDPRHTEAHYNLANLYFEHGDLRLARLHYEIAAELDPEFPELHYNLGLVLALIPDYEAAVDALLKYKKLASGEHSAKADELLNRLKTILENR